MLVTINTLSISLFFLLLFQSAVLSAEDNGKNKINESDSLTARVTKHYVQLAHARYEDSLLVAEVMQNSILQFVQNPNLETHEQAKSAWLKAHSAYSHTEVFRFGNPNVDEWESKVNAWPMDEGFVDYVSVEDYVHDAGNLHAQANLIGSKALLRDDVLAELFSGTDPKAAPITGFADFETNITIGFHVIEFLLWGQDLNRKPGSSGDRKYTDYLVGDGCTNENCQRRADYLSAVSRILIQDLMFMVQDWDPAKDKYYAAIFSGLSLETQLGRILHGMGSLSNGELAGERTRVALLASDQEDEQNCFSDTTHHALYHNAFSIKSLYKGLHNFNDGRKISGPSLSELVATLDPQLDKTLKKQFEETLSAATEIMNAAENGEPFDQMIQPENTAGRERVWKFIKALKQQTVTIEKIQKRISELALL